MKRLLLIFTAFTASTAFTAFLALPVHAYSSNICTRGATCTAGEVGIFMADISSACGNTGDCTLNDILLLFTNIGNYIIGIIGAIVLVMYVAGGFYYLIAGSGAERTKKGKSLMTNATIGLLIVMFSYLGIYALRGVLQKGTVAVEGNYAACNGAADTIGDACDLNSTCTANGMCEPLCRQNHPNPQYDPTYFPGQTRVTYFDCVDRNGVMPTSDDNHNNRQWYDPGSCVPNQCWGGVSTQCCQVNFVVSN